MIEYTAQQEEVVERAVSLSWEINNPMNGRLYYADRGES